MKKQQSESEMDLLESVDKSPQLTSYVIRNKLCEAKKNAIIMCLIASFLAFIVGFMIGMNIFHIGQPKNIVEVQVSEK